MEEKRIGQNFQGEGNLSNAEVGRQFEKIAMEVFKAEGLSLNPDHKVLVGVGSEKKLHAFDLGSDDPKVLVECKSHTWTKGNNVPSAKMTIWNEAMYYFAVAPSEYRKIMFVLQNRRRSNQETLAEYYARTYQYLIPPDVELWEYEPSSRDLRKLVGVPKTNQIGVGR